MTALRGFRGVGSSAVARIATLPVTALAGLATSSIVIATTGNNGFAALSVATTLTQLIPFADLGVGAGVVNALARSQQEARAAVSSALRITFTSGAIVILVALGGLTIFPIAEFLGVSGSSIEHIDWAISGALVLFAVAMPLSLGQRVLIGVMRNPSAIIIAAVAPLVSLALTVVILWAALPFWLFGLTPTLGLIAANTIALVTAIRAIGYKLRSVLDRASRSAGMIGQGAAFTVGTIALSAMLPLGRLVVARESTLEDLAEFSLIMQMYLPMLSVVSAAAVSLWPHFALRRELGRSSVMTVAKISGVFTSAGLAGATVLVLLGEPVGALVSGEVIVIGSSTLIAAGVLLVIQSSQLVIGMALTSPTGLWFQAAFSIPMGVTAFIIAVVSAPHLGAAAPFLSAAVALFLFALVPGAVRIVSMGRGAR